MSWADFILLLQDIAGHAAGVALFIACAAAAGAACGLTSTPEHRDRYRRAAEDEAGDTHANWQLHRLDLQRTRPRPHVRAISGVRAASQAQLKPSFDSRRAAADRRPD